MNEPRSMTYRATTRDAAEEQYHADARRALDDGFVPRAEDWSAALGQQVLTVQYVHAPSEVTAVRSALADLARQGPAVTSPRLGTTAVAPAPLAAPTSSSSMALAAGLAWLATAAFTAFLAFQQWDAYRQLASYSLDTLGLDGVAAGNGVAAVLTGIFAIRCFNRPGRSFWAWSIAWSAINVALGVVQVVGGSTYWVFFVVIIASGVAGLLSLAARNELARA